MAYIKVLNITLKQKENVLWIQGVRAFIVLYIKHVSCCK